MLNPFGGFLYLPDQPRPQTGSAELHAEFPGLSFEGRIWIFSLDAVFPVFELSGFKISGQGFHVSFPSFEVDLHLLGGRNFELDIDFPVFEVNLVAAKGTTLAVEFEPFAVALTLRPGNQSLVLDADWPGLVFKATLREDRSETASYEVWVINQRTGAHSTYSNWPANSYGRFNGQEIVALDDGLYLLQKGKDGTEDVSARIHWAPADLGSSKQKRVESLAMNLRNLDQADLRIMVVVDEQEARYYTKRVNDVHTGLKRHRKTLPRGLQGQTWQFGIENVSGGEILLDEVEVLAVELERQFK